MTDDVKKAMEAVQSLPKEARAMTVEGITNHVSDLLEMRRLAKEGEESYKKYGGIPSDVVFKRIKEKYGLQG